MPNKQPTFTVTFKELAVSAIQRQPRGHVLMVLNSDVDMKTYYSLNEVKKTGFDTNDYLALQLCFKGNPKKVTVVSAEDKADDLCEKLDKFDNYTLVYPSASDSMISSIKSYLGAQRQKNNYSMMIVAGKENLDSQFVVNFASSGIKIFHEGETKTITSALYTARIAGALAGLSASRSLTYFELPEVVDADVSSDSDLEVQKGNLVIIYQDGSFKLGRAVNTLVTLTDGITEAFQKIRITNVMDMIANDIISTFRKNYVGKYINNYVNKKRFIGAVNTYLNSLAADGLLDEANDNEIYLSYEKIKNYIEGKGVSTKNMTYTDIITYNTGSYVFVDGVCSPTDCMEDLDLGFYLFQALESEA